MDVFVMGFMKWLSSNINIGLVAMIVNYEDKCLCGHRLASHTCYAPYDNNNNVSFEIALSNRYKYGCAGQGTKCSCKKFQLTNLKYLEWLYEQKTIRQKK